MMVGSALADDSSRPIRGSNLIMVVHLIEEIERLIEEGRLECTEELFRRLEEALRETTPRERSGIRRIPR